MQNRSNIYTINDAAPPSYAEATEASISKTYDLQFGQRYPHMVANWSPSVPIQPVNQECVLELPQSEPMRVVLIRRPKKTGNQCGICLGLIFLLVIICTIIGLSYVH